MFRHKSKSRTLAHNLSIASLLSFVAGIVNIVGYLSVKHLTTNVTGHFAFMIDEIIEVNFNQSFFYFLFILLFLAGAFFSNLLIEITGKVNDKFIYIVPVFVEIIILSIIASLHFDFILQNPNLIACSMLFTMGLQNSMVTTISNSAVRTTHLTGLFTDLGIELSQLFFFKSKEQQEKLFSSIKLRITIISAFLIGGIVAGALYNELKMKTLYIASVVLFTGLIIDYISVKSTINRIKKLRGMKNL